MSNGSHHPPLWCTRRFFCQSVSTVAFLSITWTISQALLRSKMICSRSRYFSGNPWFSRTSLQSRIYLLFHRHVSPDLTMRHEHSSFKLISLHRLLSPLNEPYLTLIISEAEHYRETHLKRYKLVGELPFSYLPSRQVFCISDIPVHCPQRQKSSCIKCMFSSWLYTDIENAGYSFERSQTSSTPAFDFRCAAGICMPCRLQQELQHLLFDCFPSFVGISTFARQPCIDFRRLFYRLPCPPSDLLIVLQSLYFSPVHLSIIPITCHHCAGKYFMWVS